ncbi:tripartite tricarboxylate transporter substrate binding protein [Hydrogenophaga sp. 2FB]|uniref:Bug family tripartite tricarboxylate transporter substrate binding protein n=1 Tax=Hydrogenophaga sp. 2FB TaxID=2502187 RepID=UPI001485A579|nr:tripartite tricarboxylate transporter substrate binding protein [Hydrogenophaga sp. 2FB]
MRDLTPPRPDRRHMLRHMGAAALASTVPMGQVWAKDTFPDRPVRIVVPYTPGAINDVLARAIGDKMSRTIGQSVIVDNRPGGNTLIGTQFVAKAPPDGYTLLQVPGSHAINAALLPKLPYDSINDFSFIALVARAPFLLIVNSELPFKSVAEFMAAAKQRPGHYTFASSGNGGNAHLMGELLNMQAGVQMLHVPYKGTTPAINDVMAGQVHCTFSTYSGAAAAIRSGRVRALAVTSARRAAAFPDIPTIAESGYPAYDATGWWGFAAPAGTPAPIVARLHQELTTACQAPDLVQKMKSEGVDMQVSSSAEFKAHLEREIVVWKDVVRKANIKAD